MFRYWLSHWTVPFPGSLEEVSVTMTGEEPVLGT